MSQNLGEGKRCLSQSKRAYFEKRSKGDLYSEDTMLNDPSNASMRVSGSQQSMGKILSVNENFMEMSGYTKEEIT